MFNASVTFLRQPGGASLHGETVTPPTCDLPAGQPEGVAWWVGGGGGEVGGGVVGWDHLQRQRGILSACDNRQRPTARRRCRMLCPAGAAAVMLCALADQQPLPNPLTLELNITSSACQQIGTNYVWLIFLGGWSWVFLQEKKNDSTKWLGMSLKAL